MSRTLLQHTAGAWIEEADCRLEAFVASLQQHTDLADYPHAHDVRAGVLVYSAAALAEAPRRAVQAELIRALSLSIVTPWSGRCPGATPAPRGRRP